MNVPVVSSAGGLVIRFHPPSLLVDDKRREAPPIGGVGIPPSVTPPMRWHPKAVRVPSSFLPTIPRAKVEYLPHSRDGMQAKRTKMTSKSSKDVTPSVDQVRTGN